MKKFLDKNTGYLIQSEYCLGVTPLTSFNGETPVEAIYYPANNIAHISKKSRYSAKLKHCPRSELYSELTKDALPKEKSRQTPHISGKLTERAFQSRAVEEEFNPSEPSAVTETAVIKVKSVDNLRRAHNTQGEKALASLKPSQTVSITETLDGMVDFQRIAKTVTCFHDWVKERFADDFDSGFVWIEPHEEGSWHAHDVLGFKATIPADFEDEARRWWGRRNKLECEEQLNFRFFANFNQLEKYVRDYLSPISERKRARINLYPLNCRPMRCFGNYIEPNKVLTRVADILELTNGEHTDLRRSVEVVDASTEMVIYSALNYYFDLKELDLKNYFTCVHSELKERYEFGSLIKYRDCDCACGGKTSCPNFGQCESCAAQHTSFCEGCIFNSS